MGTKLAPALATIYIGQLEEDFLERTRKQAKLWVRYVDDVFMIWPYSLEDFHVFLDELNKQRDRITFKAETSTHMCNFLDITIYKSPFFHETGTLSTKIYYKPTNVLSFPLGSSYMPTHIDKGIAIREMTRIIRNTTSPSVCNIFKKKLIKQFRHRGYPKRILRILASMKHQSRDKILFRKRNRGGIMYIGGCPWL